jgi:hypothetical protein
MVAVQAARRGMCRWDQQTPECFGSSFALSAWSIALIAQVVRIDGFDALHARRVYRHRAFNVEVLHKADFSAANQRTALRLGCRNTPNTRLFHSNPFNTPLYCRYSKMDPVSIGASIIAFIQVADRVIELSKYYLEAARDAPSDLRAILIETSTLRTILGNLQFLASCGHCPTALHIPAGEEGPVEGCLRAIKEVEALFPSGYSTPKGSKSRSKRRKVQNVLAVLAWPFKEERARKLLERLTQYKTTINFALSTESL